MKTSPNVSYPVNLLLEENADHHVTVFSVWQFKVICLLATQLIHGLLPHPFQQALTWRQYPEEVGQGSHGTASE